MPAQGMRNTCGFDPIKPVRLIWVEWRTRASGWVAHVRVCGIKVASPWTWKDVPQSRTIVDLQRVVELRQLGDEPGPGTIVGIVIVVASSVCKHGLALWPVLAAGCSTSILNGNHAHTWFHSVAKRSTCAVDGIVVDKLIL